PKKRVIAETDFMMALSRSGGKFSTCPHRSPSSLPALVRDGQHRLILALRAWTRHREDHGVGVLDLGDGLELGHLAVHARAFHKLSEDFSLLIKSSFPQHRCNGHRVDPDADVLFLHRIVAVESLALKLLAPKFAFEITHHPQAAEIHLVDHGAFGLALL